MTALLVSILVASVLGSVHCIAMCGGLAVLADQGGVSGLKVRYNVARIATYVMFGFTAGAIGHGIDDVATMIGFEKTAAALLLTLGATIALRHLLQRGAWGGLQRLRQALLKRSSPNGRSLVLGAVTALVPCGWLYAFVATAAATGSPWKGAAVMGAFGVGSAPALIAAAGGVRALQRFAPQRRRLAYAIVMIAGAVTIASRSSSLARLHQSAAAHAEGQPQLVCHGDKS